MMGRREWLLVCVTASLAGMALLYSALQSADYQGAELTGRVAYSVWRGGQTYAKLLREEEVPVVLNGEVALKKGSCVSLRGFFQNNYFHASTVEKCSKH